MWLVKIYSIFLDRKTYRAQFHGDKLLKLRHDGLDTFEISISLGTWNLSLVLEKVFTLF